MVLHRLHHGFRTSFRADWTDFDLDALDHLVDARLSGHLYTDRRTGVLTSPAGVEAIIGEKSRCTVA